MSRLIVLMVVMTTLVACEKDSCVLSMDEAVKKVEKIIKKYPNRAWYVSKSILEPETMIHYSRSGRLWERPELIHEYTSPNYRAWLVMLDEDYSGLNPDYNCLHLFINAETGKVEQVWLEGQAIVEWGSDPFSRQNK